MHNKKHVNKQAFTLIELLIVIAIIGILFVVLVSSVGGMIGKAKISGVQTDFRSYQYAVEQVAREFDGFNTLGWDTGDENGDRICNSYDENDTNKNGIQDDNEDTFTGHIGYKETWTNVYTLINPADENDNSAILALENALNKYLDPELKIRIDNDGRITMMNGMKDPWNAEYEEQYITNASDLAAAKWNTDPSMYDSIGDKNDRGAIVIWSKGPNGEFGSKIKIENGLVTTTISMTDANTPDNNESGKDDLVISIVYTFVNGYGQTGIQTHGFSNNQKFLSGHHTNINIETKEPDVDNNITNETNPDNTTDIPDAIVPDDNVVEEPDNNHDVIESDKVEPETTIEYEMISEPNKLLSYRDTTISSPAVAKFVNIKVNDMTLLPEDYDVDKTTLTITLDKWYVNTLKPGVYKVEIIAIDGKAQAFFEIQEEFHRLDKWTWADLKEIYNMHLSESELENKYAIHLGDSKNYNNVIYTLVDIDGNEYDGFVFMYDTGKNLSMNNTNTNIGGYGNTNINKLLNTDIFNEFDDELKNAIKEVNVEYCLDPNNNKSITNTMCKIFLPSIKEAGFRVAIDTPGWNAEGDIFDYFKYATIFDVVSPSMDMWLRSIMYGDQTNFEYVMGGITFMTNSYAADTIMHINACFVIG